MATTLITVLGKGRDNTQTGYRPARYQFDDNKQYATAYFGLALAQHIHPDSIIMLGTSGSMWGVLVENFATEGSDEELRLELIEAEAQSRVSQELLDRIAPLLNKVIGRPISPQLIPAGQTSDEQIGILNVIAKALGKSQQNVHFDLTHGFRHLGMIGFLSSFMLERLRSQINVAGLWYGALDMTQNHLTPVLRLDGLHAVQLWVSALDGFENSGNYALFAPLIQADGFPADKAKSLTEAAFFESTNNIPNAARSLRTVLAALEAPLQGASALFQERLKKNLAWANHQDLAEQQRILALRALERGDPLRAAILGIEALITRECQNKQSDPLDYQQRETIDKQFQKQIRDNEHPEWKRNAYWNMKNLRNAMAHGTPPAIPHLQQLMKNPQRLQNELRSILSRLTNN